MSDPNTRHEASPAAESRNEVIGRRVTWLLLGVGALVVILAAGGLALYQQTGALDGKVRALQASINDVKARIERTNVVTGGTATGMVGLLREQEKTGATLARIEAAAAPKPPAPPAPVAVLTPDHLAGLRSHFSLAPASEPARYRLGDKVPAEVLKPLPAEVADQIAPQLKGAQYLIDRNGALVVTSGAENVVVLVVAPG